MSRKITLVLKPKDASDSPQILKNIAESFQSDDITIYVEDYNPKETERNAQLENEVFDDVKEALELDNLKEPSDTITTQVEYTSKKSSNENNLVKFLKDLLKEGVKATMYASVKDWITNLLK